MELGAQESDALTEIANIGVSKAATQLSQLLKDVIHMEVPRIAVVPINQLGEVLDIKPEEEVVCIYQDLDGHFNGKSFLVFHTSECNQLVNALIGTIDIPNGTEIKVFEHEAMTEIGNIIISSCLSVIANVLDVTIELSVPNYIESNIHDIVTRYINVKDDPADHLLVLRARLTAAQRNVSGTIMITLSGDTVEKMLSRISDLTRELH